MSKVAAVTLLWGEARYSATSKESLIAGTANTSDYLFNLTLFGRVAYINESDDPFLSSIYEKINTPETAIDPSYLMENYKTLFSAYTEDYIYKNAKDTNAVIYMKCPYTTDSSCFLVDDRFTDPAEFLNWADNLSKYGLPPRTREEIERDRAEEKRLAELRPPQQGSIALVHIVNSDTFELSIITLDLANTKVSQIRTALSKAFKLPGASSGLVSTNHFSVDQVKELAVAASKDAPTRHYAVNMFMSVVDGKKYGSEPAVGVPPNSRSTLSDNMRLSDMKGNVVVYYYNETLKESLGNKLSEAMSIITIDTII